MSIINRGDDYFAVVTYTGNGTSQTISGLRFQPDFVWIKGRSGATDHALYDAARGVQNRLESNTTDAQATSDNGVTAFNSNGFSVGSLAQVNTNGATYVAWCWKANGAGVTNTAGSITSTVSANPTAGFSIVTYSGNSTAAATVGHGLGVTPSMIITKRRNASSSWAVSHAAYANTSLLFLESTIALVTGAGTRLQRTNSSVFTVGDAADYNVTNASGGTYVAYCFSEVAGYSRFGSYTGNGSTDGPFVFCGFRPKFIIGKRTDATNGWFMFDATRDSFNVVDDYVSANGSAAEQTFTFGDFLSNGFKIRATTSDWNGNGGTIIYAAFAENPFKNALAR